MRPRLSPARLIPLVVALLPQPANCIVAFCLQSDNEPQASECERAIQQILEYTPPSDLVQQQTWLPIPDGMDDDPHFHDMMACGAQWIAGSCAVTIGCDQVTRASLLQIHDTAARAVEMCVGPQGQSPGQSFDALAFFDDTMRSDWWVTVGRLDDVLYYHVEVEHRLEVFRVRAETTLAHLLVWYQIQFDSG